jgi:hypothetical protein
MHAVVHQTAIAVYPPCAMIRHVCSVFVAYTHAWDVFLQLCFCLCGLHWVRWHIVPINWCIGAAIQGVSLPTCLAPLAERAWTVGNLGAKNSKILKGCVASPHTCGGFE